MNRYTTSCGTGFQPVIVVTAFISLVFMAGCKDPISIQPSCPAELEVGESGQLFSNVQNPGAIATYRWRIFAVESARGEIDDPTAPDPIFTAQQPGKVFLQLTARDGLWEAESQCETEIIASTKLVVMFEADPTTAAPGETVTLTCSDIGGIEVVEFRITQPDGDEVELQETETDGVVEFDAPDEAGELEFQCVGLDAEDNESDPATVTVTVQEGEEGGG